MTRRLPVYLPLSLAVVALVAILATAFPAPAQQTAKVLATCGTATYTAGATNYVTMDTTGAACGSGGGGGGGTSSTFGAAFPATGTAIGFKDSTGTNMVAGNLDASGFLKVNVAAGSAANSAASATGAAVPANAGYTGLNNGGNLIGWVADSSGRGIVAGAGVAGTPAGGLMTIQGAASMTKLLVTPDSVALPANQSVNEAQVNGVTILTGTGAYGTGSPRVTIAQDAATAGGCITGLVGFPTAGCVFTVQGAGATASPVIVAGRTAVGSAAANPPVLMGGTADATATGTVQVQKIDSGGDSFNNLAEYGGTAVVNGGVAGSVGIGGQAANNASTAGNPVQESGLAESAEPTLATNGQNASVAVDLAHRTIVYPFANKENEVTSGAVVLTASTASTSAIGVPGSGLYIYVTDIDCFNSGATATTLLVQNGSGGATIWEGYALNGGGGWTKHFDTPIGGLNHMTVNTAVFIQAGSSTSSLICNLQGFKGS